MELGDIDWRRAGEIMVRGKGRQYDRMPLPVDVGEAIVANMRDGRPRTECRNVFLTRYAPIHAVGSPVVSQLVYDACERAGIPPVRSHRLRHALASEMLRQGLAFTAISQVLRHRDLESTAVYAKVDHITLRTVAQPWPGGTS